MKKRYVLLGLPMWQHSSLSGPPTLPRKTQRE